MPRLVAGELARVSPISNSGELAIHYTIDIYIICPEGHTENFCKKFSFVTTPHPSLLSLYMGVSLSLYTRVYICALSLRNLVSPSRDPFTLALPSGTHPRSSSRRPACLCALLGTVPQVSPLGLPVPHFSLGCLVGLGWVPGSSSRVGSSLVYLIQ